MNPSLILLENFLQALFAGLLIGGIYGLMCVGLGIIFGVMRVINFGQGDLLMLGMYFAWYMVTGFGILAFMGPYFGPMFAAVLTFPALYIVGVFLHKFLVSKVTGIRVAGMEGEGHYAQLILTLGLSLILANGGLLVFGSEPRSISTPMSKTAFEIGPLVGRDVSVFLNQARLFGLVLALAVAAALYLFITRSRLGKSLRAAADNPEAAIYMGIDVDRACLLYTSPSPRD